MITRETLRGVHAAVPIPWDDAGELMEATFRDDVGRLCDSGVQGLYTTGTTGEFYALDFDEFRRIVDAFAAETRNSRVLTQVGCTAINNREAMKRAAYAASKGIHGIQVALPFWMPLTDWEVVAFFKDIHATSGLPIVHYNTGRSKRVLGPREYALIASDVPALVGTKLAGGDFSAVSAVLIEVPELAHFVGETVLAPALMLGAKGTYSSIALMDPGLVLTLYDACEAGVWSEVAALQRSVTKFVVEALYPLLEDGYWDAAIDKAMIAATGFLACPPAVRKPYREVPAEKIAALRAYVERNLPRSIRAPGMDTEPSADVPRH
jgi:dihydrodipicolinate synthase/N-acetylneuraminate lyase